MKVFLLLLVITFFSDYLSAQSLHGRIVDKDTREAIPDASVCNTSGQALTFSNPEGFFVLTGLRDTAHISIHCLGYITQILPVASLETDSVIRLKPAIYSLPVVFVGDYAGSLIRKAYRKADSLQNHYYFGQGFDLQLLWLNRKPKECYEFLQDLKLSSTGLVAREITAARHGLIKDSTLSASILSSFHQFAEQLNWMKKNTNVKKLLKKNDFNIEKIISDGAREIAKIHFTPKKKNKRYQKEGYYYIDIHTSDVLRYEARATISKFSIPLLVKFYDWTIRLVQNFDPAAPYPHLANTSIGLKVYASFWRGRQIDTMRYQDKFYVFRPVPWNDSISFNPERLKTRNNNLFKKYGDNGRTGLPVVLSGEEKDFLHYMEQHDAFE